MRFTFLQILFNGILIVILFFAITSSQNGVNGAAASGCGGGACHGNESNNTTVWIAGMPDSGYFSGKTYDMQAIVVNTLKTKAGFNLQVNEGTIIADTGTILSGSKDITHASPKAIISDTCKWNFKFITPMNNIPITFLIAGNAVNDNSSNTGDAWAKLPFSFNGLTTTNIYIDEYKKMNVIIYPNPCSEKIFIKNISTTKENIYIYNMKGKLMKTILANTNISNGIDVQELSVGHYCIASKLNNQQSTQFIYKK